MRLIAIVILTTIMVCSASEVQGQSASSKESIARLNREFKQLKKDLRKQYDVQRKATSSAQQDELETVFWKKRQQLRSDKKSIKRSLKTNPKYTYELQIAGIESAPVATETFEAEEETTLELPLISAAEQHIGTPYRYGGTSTRGFDCSGFVQHVFVGNGHQLPRTSNDQSKSGTKVSVADVEPGDLLFFSHGGSKIDHVGIVTRAEKGVLEMIHCSSSSGVIKTDVKNSQYWKPRLKKARRIL